MNPAGIPAYLERLRNLGIRLEAQGHELRVVGPADKMTPDLWSELRAGKEALLSHLSSSIEKAGDSKEEPLEVSVGQVSLWKKHESHPLKSFYNVPRALRISGPLDEERLARAIRTCVHRHEALRTNFLPGKKGPTTVVREHAAFDLERRDFSAEADPDASALLFMREEASKPFHIGEDCLLRATLLKLSGTDFLLLITAHHLAADCWSLGFAFQSVSDATDLWHPGLLLESMWNLYLNKPVKTEDSQAAYRDFASWQRKMLSSSAWRDQHEFWSPRWQIRENELLFGSRDARAHAGRRIPFSLPRDLSGDIRAAAAPLGTTPHALLFAAFNILLFRWKECSEPVVGMPVANRRDPQHQSIIGNFGNNVLVRTKLNGSSTFLESVRAVHLNVLDSLDNQDYPLELLQDEFDPHRLLPEVRFILQSPRHSRHLGEGLEVTPLPIERGTSKHPLSLIVVEQPSGFRGWAEMSAGSMDPVLFGRFLELFLDYVRMGLSHPGTRLSQFPKPTF